MGATGGEGVSAFLGEGLVQLLTMALRVDEDMELLKEFDWYVEAIFKLIMMFCVKVSDPLFQGFDG